MEKTTITFRVDARIKNALDAIATGMDRDRSDILNEAITAYLDAHEWQIEHIKKGLRQADAGKFASQKEVARAMARWREGRRR